MASNHPSASSTAGLSSNSAASLPPPTYTVTSQCACGQVQVRANVSSSSSSPSSPLERVDCHCPTCRKFHAAAFVSYLPVRDGDDYQVLRGTTLAYRDSCSGLLYDGDAEGSTGTPQPVLHIVCDKCNSKLLTTTADLATAEEEGSGVSDSRSQEAQPKRAWINMGPLLEGKGRFPTPLLGLKPRSTGGQPVAWSVARPHDTTGDEAAESDRPSYAHGRCACGKSRYRFLNEETELQHCYCRLCRQYSGGPFMTWMPAPYLEWLDARGQPDRAAEPPLVRTTSHGRRHFCPSCRACLTIVYDDQPETIWPVAASLEDSTALTLYGVSHICCRYRPRWYELPKDGLPRTQEAS